MENYEVLKPEEVVIDAERVDPRILRNAEYFEKQLKAVIQQIRAVMNAAELGYMKFEIQAQGRVQGDIKIVFGMSTASYGGEVNGHKIQPVLNELLRRHGWDKRHQPISLTYSGDEVHDDE